MRRRLLLTGTLASAATALAACGGSRRDQPLPDYASEPPLRLMVSELRVDQTFPPLPEANFIDERRTEELAAAARNLLQARLQASGGIAYAQATLPQVSLTERLRTDRSGGMKGLVTREPAYDLDAAITVRIGIIDGSGAEAAWARAGVGRSRSLRAGTSVVERDNAARALIADLMSQLDKAVEQSVRENLAAYLGY
ncbi:hypothetical protein SH611_09465 [Geminicoccaceae bacterium 1502E]|nr:hypothetical protein [Geminicoccaceae bacterium 1502E]